jgi:hypothetical protein
MLLYEIHDAEQKLIAPILSSLVDLANKNQTHPQDLFLVANLGCYDRKLEGNEAGLCKYTLGLPSEAGMNTGGPMILSANTEQKCSPH